MLQLQKAQRFVLDFDDNRARFARGESAASVMLRPPTAFVWRQFWSGMALKRRLIPDHLREAMNHDENAETGLAIYLATLDDGMAEILFLGCVQSIEWPDDLVPGFKPNDALELWEARKSLSSFRLFQSVLEACVNAVSLSEGLASFLESGRGQLVSAEKTDGIVASVGAGA